MTMKQWLVSLIYLKNKQNVVVDCGIVPISVKKKAMLSWIPGVILKQQDSGTILHMDSTNERGCYCVSLLLNCWGHTPTFFLRFDVKIFTWHQVRFTGCLAASLVTWFQNDWKILNVNFIAWEPTSSCHEMFPLIKEMLRFLIMVSHAMKVWYSFK